MVEALLGAKQRGEHAFDIFMATFTLREVQRNDNGWEEVGAEATDWEAHPDLALPNAVLKAAEGMGMPDLSEIVQGEDYWDTQDEDHISESDDSEDEEDDDDYYHRRRYGYDYDDYHRERSKKQRRHKERVAIVLWPRRARAAVLDAASLLGLLESVLDGNEEALAGFTDVAALQAACASRSDWTAPQRLRLLAAALVPPIGLEACVGAIRKLPVASLKSDEVVPVLARAAARHCDAGPAAAVRQAIVACATGGATSGEAASQASWALLEQMAKAPELVEVASEVADKLVHCLSSVHSRTAPAGPSSYQLRASSTERTASATLTSALCALARMGLTEALATAASLAAKNTVRFPPIGAVAPALAKVRQSLRSGDGVEDGGAGDASWAKSLVDAVTAAVSQPNRMPMSVEEMTAVFGVLHDFSAAGPALSAVGRADAAAFPLVNLLAAATKLIADAARRAAMLAEAAWPRALLKMFEKTASLSNPSQSPRPVYSSVPVPRFAPAQNIDTLVSLYVLLSTFDAEAHTASPSYRKQLSALVTTARWDAVQVTTPLVLALAQKLDLAGRRHPAFRALMQPALEALRKATAAPPTQAKDWKVTTAIGCNCSTCKAATTILLDPLKEGGMLHGMNYIFTGHSSLLIEAASKKPNSGFRFTQVSSKAAKRQGSIAISKTPAGQTPVAQLRVQQAQSHERQGHLATLRKLEEIEDEVTAPSKDQPVTDTRKYVRLLHALREGGHAAVSALATSLAKDESSSTALAATIVDPSAAAAQAAQAARAVQVDGDNDGGGAAGLEGEAVVKWAVGHLPEGAREAAASALVEEEAAEMEVLRSMTHAELVRCHPRPWPCR